MSSRQKGSFAQFLIDIMRPRVDCHGAQDSSKTISICVVGECSCIQTMLVNRSRFPSCSLFKGPEVALRGGVDECMQRPRREGRLRIQ